MTILREDIYSRARRGEGAGRARRPGLLLFILMFVSVSLLVLSKLNHGLVHETRRQIAEIVAPALSAAMVPLQPLRRYSRQITAHYRLSEELQRLKDENRRLKGWQWRAKELRRRMTQLAALAQVVEEPGLDFVSGRVIADAGGPFVRVALINAGAANGVKGGYPVINGDGLVGRIVDTGRAASRLLLLTDLNSRVPVMIGAAGHRALLLGDNGPRPKLGYPPSGVTFEPGDEIYTSGIGGLFPRGLRIGVVARAGDAVTAALHARLDELEYVSVLFFETPTLTLSAESRNRGTKGRLTPSSGRARRRRR